MGGAKFDTTEVRALATSLSTSGVRVGTKAATVFRRAAYAIQADAQAHAPVDTGALRSSISTTISGDAGTAGMTAEIGPTVDYGIYVELGTSRAGAQPYMAPAFDRQVGGFAEALAQIAASEVL